MYLTSKKGKSSRTNKKQVGMKSYKSGIVYLIVIKLDCGSEVYKCGCTGRKDIQHRLFEIASTLLLVHGYVPRMEVLWQQRTKEYYKAEGMMHLVLKEYNCKVDDRYSGSTEWFQNIDIDSVVPEYKRIMKECNIKEDTPKIVDYDPITGEIIE